MSYDQDNVDSENHGPNSSNDIDSFERSKTNKQLNNLNQLTQDLFKKMNVYLQGEVESTIQDYSLLQEMNVVTSERYEKMLQTAKNVGDTLYGINSKIRELQPYLHQIEEIEQNVLILEKTANKLDTYTKQLEERFQKIEKR